MTKIATILPYKENYSLNKAAAASLWICDFFKHSKLKKESNIVKDKINVCWSLIMISSSIFDGIKPPEEIMVKDKLTASKSLIFTKLYKKITKIVEKK